MTAGDLAIDFSTIVLVMFVLALLWTLRTMFLYFLGGNDPLMRNTGARIEANRKPEELLPVARAYEGEKRFRAILALILVMWILYAINPDAFVQLAASVWQVIVRGAQMAADFIRQLMTRLVQ
ncbi:MAG TPA: hypothetical protein DCL15_07165 [Chloroflexi bacterium]|nr:hypothetical protein [Chloroflexota bacterium]HHW88452.1 hypothetical protein [Chloroflexota bacterium]